MRRERVNVVDHESEKQRRTPPGQILVKTNKGILCSAAGGFEDPNVDASRVM